MIKDIVKFESEKQIHAVATDILSEVKALKITSQPKYLEVNQIAAICTMAVRKIDEYFEPMRAPAYEALQAIYDKIKSAKKPFQDAGRLARDRMVEYKLEQDKKAAEATAKQAAKAEEKGVLAPPPVQNKAKVEGTTYIENYEVELTDWDAFVQAVAKGKFPRNFLLVQLGEVKKFANSQKGQVEIPGVKITRKDIVRLG